MFRGKNILIGITGGIAAYKICELIRMLKKNNANVKVLTTENALNFVTATTLEALSGNRVYCKQYDRENFSTEHISLTDWADIFVVAPLSANTLSKFATGICDNLLTSVFCAFQKPVILCPAMNTGMLENPFVVENTKKLEEKGYIFIDSEIGFLACGVDGKGRLASLDKIFDKIKEILQINNFLKDKKIVVTAGGTRENIDPVRYISNFSSGKMGFEIADNAYKNGADVVLITTVKCEKPYKTIFVNSATEMQKTTEQEFINADALIMAAAVADYRVENISDIKIKKKDEKISLNLVKNPDIISEISKIKKENQIIVGFCAETNDLEKNAQEKLKRKNIDFIVANDVSRTDIGFSSDENEVIIYNKEGKSFFIEKKSKKEIAKEILEIVYASECSENNK